MLKEKVDVRALQRNRKRASSALIIDDDERSAVRAHASDERRRPRGGELCTEYCILHSTVYSITLMCVTEYCVAETSI